MIALALMAILSGVDSDLSDPVPRQDRTGVYPRIDRRDRIGAADAALFRLLPASGLPVTDSGCDGVALVGTRGEAITLARASSATCTRGDGLMFLLTSNKPRLSSFGLLMEGAHTSLALQARDLGTASWTKSSMTCTLDAVGRDGTASSASTCTASGANGTVLQGLTVAAATRTTSFSIKRVTGSGNVDITRDNGSTWTTLTSAQCYDPGTRVATAINSASFVRCWLASSVLNPTIGLRLVTNGDSVVVDVAGDTDSAFPVSEIITTTTSVAQAADDASAANPTGFSNTEGCEGGTVRIPGVAVVIVATNGVVGRQLTFADTTTAVVGDGANNASKGTTNVLNRSADAVGRWSAAGIQACADGACGTVNTSYSGTMLGSAVNFGSRPTGTVSINGYIYNIRLGSQTGACDR